MKRFALFILFVVCVSNTYAQKVVDLYEATNNKAMNHWVDSVMKTMTFDEKVGQLFMVVADPASSWNDKVNKYIHDLHIGGLLFSGGKLTDQAKNTNLYQKNSKIPLLISFDGEWGLAMRLKNDTPLFPHNMMLGAIQDNNLIRQYGKEVGRECNQLGVHINFAPVLDVNNNPANPVIGDRSFGENPFLVTEKGIAYAEGLESKNVIAVGKHFPGHGDTDTDSHKALPKINHNQARLDSVELYPFTRFIDEGFAGIMTGHLSVPALDSKTNLPTSLSPEIVEKLLVSELGFSGLTFTDALVMQGAISGKHNPCVQALLAGNDVLLSPSNPEKDYIAVRQAIENGIISPESIEKKCRKILQYKYIVGLNQYVPIQIEGLQERINSSHADFLIEKLNEAAITLLKNKDNSIPIKDLEKKRIAIVMVGDSEKKSFFETISLYTDAEFFAVDALTENTLSQLKNYNTVICAIASTKASDSAILQTICRQKETHLCFFISPYRLKRFGESIKLANTVTLAYENTSPSQKAAAQVIMGGIAAKGKLPVTISGLFDYSTGIETEKTRLSYGHPEDVGMSRQTLNHIDEIVAEGIEAKAFPGCQVLVAKDGVVVYHKSFGHFDYSGKRQVKNNDLYDLASITKAAATVPAIMKLFDNQKIQLRDRLSKYIPELRESDKSHLTIQNALFHETGLRSFLPFYTTLLDSSSYRGSLYSSKKNELYSILYDRNVYMRNDVSYDYNFVSTKEQAGFGKLMAEGIYVKDEINKEILQQIVDSKIGRVNNYLYSDLNFILLKELVENVSKLPFDEFVHDNFFAPLGSTTTTFLPLNKFDKEVIAPTENDQFLRKQVLQGYVHDEAAAVLGGISGNSGLFSNANDLAKLLQMLLNGGEYGETSFFSKTTTKTFVESKSNFSRRGLGFDKPDPKNIERSPAGSLTPSCVIGHTGYTGTCFWIDPSNNLIYIFLSNRVHPSRTRTDLMGLNIRPRIQDVIYQAIQ
ncbi:serine hydrolase [Bacteroidales bacterium OttesenSCG-928-M11]|nr:serine hydrolase [Bacteroidales bacterium OttesenSCG-928-M11]